MARKGGSTVNALLKAVWNLVFHLTGIDLSYDARYADWSLSLAEYRARYQAVKELLKERELVPMETEPGETRVQIAACEFRAVQVAGPYNEVSIHVPVESLTGDAGERSAHLWLPVSTKAARWPGVDIYGFPKFVARIEIEREGGRVRCRLAEEDTQVLDFAVPQSPGTQQQLSWAYYGCRKRQIVMTRFDLSGSIYAGESDQPVDLVLGQHRIADTLRGLLLSERAERIVVGSAMSGYLRKPVPVGNAVRTA